MRQAPLAVPLAVFLGIITLLGYFVYQSGWLGRKIAVVTGYSSTCIDGVVYLQFASGATVKYGTDGKIATCGSR